jgi:hypothetical protein
MKKFEISFIAKFFYRTIYFKQRKTKIKSRILNFVL